MFREDKENFSLVDFFKEELARERERENRREKFKCMIGMDNVDVDTLMYDRRLNSFRTALLKMVQQSVLV